MFWCKFFGKWSKESDRHLSLQLLWHCSYVDLFSVCRLKIKHIKKEKAKMTALLIHVELQPHYYGGSLSLLRVIPYRHLCLPLARPSFYFIFQFNPVLSFVIWLMAPKSIGFIHSNNSLLYPEYNYSTFLRKIKFFGVLFFSLMFLNLVSV